MVGLNVDFPTFRGTESKGYIFLPKEPTLCMLRRILLTFLVTNHLPYSTYIDWFHLLRHFYTNLTLIAMCIFSHSMQLNE
jgi:hypothetical protein